MYQLDAPLSPLTYHFAVLPERCTYWECQADLCKAHTIFPPSANNTQYAHFSDNTSTTQGLTQPPHHVQSKNFFRANCSYYRVKVPEQPPNANLSHPTKVQTDHLHHTPKHPHSTHHSMYHTHHPSSPEHLPGIPIDNQPQPPYPPQFPALLRQYQHVFSRNKFAVPCLKVPPVRIATNSDKVVTIRPYRVPICDQREIRSQIRQMLDNDIIEPSYSPFSSPVTLVTKRDKTKRFCIDYRKVNEVISSDVHPLPRIEDILDRLARAKYFSTADVSSAYWQVPIHPDSRPLLAFATIDGLYQPTRLPFGLKTSPQIYERAINQVLQGHGLDCVAHYFDDFVIYSETLEEHQEHLRKFFAFCDAENLQLNLTKCEFFRQTIEFLGYTITAGTTTPLIRNTDVIHAIPPPNNRKTLQSFLGAVNVYNKFIPDYARLRTPLNNLLKKDVTWDWDDKCQKAFTSLKESLTQHPVLHLYKDELPCQVYCDASTLGIAGVLKQVHSAGKAYPVQYFSRALRVHERNYTISELECLAIVESVEKFRVYLMGRKFTIFSDHHALQWLKTIKNPSGRLFRWSLRLSCYEYEVRYIKGALQHEADLLSRNPFCGFLDATLIKNHQLTPSGESKLTIDRNGLQTLKRRGVTKIVVPDALVPDLLTKVHSRYNHPGISQMTRLISPQYYWKGMSEDISKTTKACAICQSTKPPRGPTFGELGQLPVATQPFDLVALDTIAGLAKYGNAKAYLHVVVDHFSRYTWTFPSKSTSITTYQQVIKRVLQDGSPKRLLTDRAPAFTSPKFRKFLINRNIHPLLTTSNNPQANGLCERLNATLTGKLRLLHLENPKAAWTKLAKRVTVVYNNTPHSVTGFPPGYLMFGVLPPELTEHVNPYPVLTTARRIAHERTQAKHLKDKHAYDQQHKTPHFEPGDLVLVKVYHHPNTGKLAPYFTGPYEILEIISPNVVRINRPNQPLNRNTDTVHVNKLQYYNENIRYIAPPTLIPHPAKPQSRTLPPLFEHLTPDLFTVERFAPTIGNCTTTTPVDPQCNIIAQRDIPQPAISRPTHITKVKTPIPTVRADPNPIPLQARFFHNVKTFPLFHLLYLINLFILPTVLLPMATLLYVSVYTLQPNRLFQLQEALFEITIAVVELIHRTIGIILPELWTILVHSHALVALLEVVGKMACGKAHTGGRFQEQTPVRSRSGRKEKARGLPWEQLAWCSEVLENSPPLTVPRGYYRFDPRLPQLIARVDEDYHNEGDHNEEGKDCPDRKEPRSKMEEQTNPSNDTAEQTIPKQETTLEEEETSPPQDTSADPLTQIADALSKLLVARSPREIDVSPYDGTFEAQSFFDNFDAQADRTELTYTDRLRKLPCYLQGKPLQYFRSLRLDRLYYIEARQRLIDLFPATTEASFARFLAIKMTPQMSLEDYYQNKTVMGMKLDLPADILIESLTDGLPVADQRLVATVQPNTIKEWFDLVSRITQCATSAVNQRQVDKAPHPTYHNPPPRYNSQRPSRVTYPVTPPPSPCKYCNAMHWHSQCGQRPRSNLRAMFPKSKLQAKTTLQAPRAAQRCSEVLENSPPLTVPRGYYRFDPRLPQLIARVDELPPPPPCQILDPLAPASSTSGRFAPFCGLLGPQVLGFKYLLPPIPSATSPGFLAYSTHPPHGTLALFPCLPNVSTTPARYLLPPDPRVPCHLTSSLGSKIITFVVVKVLKPRFERTSSVELTFSSDGRNQLALPGRSEEVVPATLPRTLDCDGSIVGNAVKCLALRMLLWMYKNTAVQPSNPTSECNVYLEFSPDFSQAQYFLALEMKPGKGCVYQMMKMEGHILIGFFSMQLAENLIEESLDIRM
ncbi:hypothetical protein LAZ67_10002416 [Cordylochernes scorpioides]|uniref:RNA-directed DNA polymerase n=1 Tax=Cordylochernes scorpioides TaxID=51811 RepID=A0ABY6KWM3_9ARAC|nr:hypothetical protein LAZ67_10002416 [Cordylochernes scorpioides]